MPDDLVTIASFGNAQQASVARATLDGEGIPAWISGAEAATTLWYVGTALGGVKLHVSEDDAERAARVLGELHQSSTETPAQCPECGAELDEGFELCWSCGAVVTEADSTARDPGEPVDLAQQPESRDRTAARPEPPPAGENAAGPDSAEETVVRAWKAAVIGVAFVPLLFYAAGLVLTVSGRKLSPAGTRRFYGTLFVAGTMIPAWFCFLVWLR